MSLDFATLAAALLLQAPVLLSAWLPAGKLRGHEFVIGDLAGNPGESLSINVNTGKWADFASGDKGGDLISLYAAMHHLSQVDAAAQLSKIHTAAPARKQDRRRRQVITPIPPGVPACSCQHYKLGEPSKVWAYRNAAGELLGYVARYDPPGQDKEIIPWTYAADLNGKRRWGMGQWLDPRPLYGLDDLASRPEAPVLIVEGEKAADAARKLAAQYVVTAWPGGSHAWRKAGWNVLKGRTVLLWPDADDPGIKCMSEVGHALLRLCPTVKLIVPELREGWDAADAVAEGWDWQRFKDWAQPRVTVVHEGGSHASNTPAARVAAFADAQSDGRSGDGSSSDRPTGTAAASTEAVAGEGASPGPEAPSRYARWMAWNLDRSGNGDPVPNLNNAVAILEHDRSLEKHIWYDEFLDRMLTGDPVREWKDFDDINLALYMQRAIGLTKISRDTVSQAVIAMAFRDVRNCVKDWLDRLVWDKETRIDHFFEDHFGAAGTSYTRAASRNFWLSLVARAYRPGCKADNMIVLEGNQGVGKSGALKAIGGEWFTEQHQSAADPKGFGEVLQGKWLIEIAEMDAFSRTEVTRVKAVVSNQNDRFRGSYKRYAEDHQRRCIFVGTTNKDDWNRDETGARRFWPIRCSGDVDVSAIAANRDQCFAEAAARFKAGESWWQMPDEETRQQQRARFQEDPWQEIVHRYLTHEELNSSWVERLVPLATTTVNELLQYAIKLPQERWSRLEQMRIASILKHAGWLRKKHSDGKWKYVREVYGMDSTGDVGFSQQAIR